MQLSTLHKESVVSATIALATEKAVRLDHQIIEQDNAISAIVDPLKISEIPQKWLPTANRETPSVKAVLVLDESGTILSFTSRSHTTFAEEFAFQKLLISELKEQLDFDNLTPDTLQSPLWALLSLFFYRALKICYPFY